MLRRPPTAITLNNEDIHRYDERALARRMAENAARDAAANRGGAANWETGNSFQDALRQQREAAKKVKDPNDELRPLPGDTRGRTREERIGVGR